MDGKAVERTGQLVGHVGPGDVGTRSARDRSLIEPAMRLFCGYAESRKFATDDGEADSDGGGNGQRQDAEPTLSG